MRAKWTNMIWRYLIAGCCALSFSVAYGAIADDDLLKMIEAAGSEAQPPATQAVEEPSNPVEAAAAVAAEVEERAEEADEAMAEPVVETPVVIPSDEPSAVQEIEQPLEEPVEANVETVDAVQAVAVEQPAADVIEETPAQEASVTVAEEPEVDALGMDSYDETVASSKEELISVRLNKVGLEEAINLFAQLSGANIIVPELTEAAQISINLKDVEWRPALQSILDSYNYELYQKVSGSNVFSVRRRPVGAPEPQVVETFTLRYATVPNAAELVRALLPEDAKISEFASRNMLVVKSTESSLSEVRSVLASIDTLRQQVFIESKFMELGDKAQKDLGVDWKMLQSYKVAANGLRSSLTDTDSESTSTERMFDRLGNQIDGASAPEFIDTGDGATFVEYQEVTPSIVKTTQDSLSRVSTAVLDADELAIVLSALEEDTDANMVSNPKIIVANEEKANIAIVRKEPNLKQERQQTAAAQGGAAIDNIVFTLDPEMPFFEYGIKLDVTPSINTSSNITVKIKPSLTRFVSNKEAGDNSYPIFDEKTIETVFSLSSGQTAAIGGLTEVMDSQIARKVPLLGNIPMLGRLFSWEQTVSDTRETIIFVTVGLANTQEIELETGLPEDSELARRRIIRERNKKAYRARSRELYENEESDKLEDMIDNLNAQEARREEQRAHQLAKKQENAG